MASSTDIGSSSDPDTSPMLSDMDLSDHEAVEEMIQAIKAMDLTPDQLEEQSIEVTNHQYDAITYPYNHNLLLSIRSGPGSGKTHTIVNRIAYLVGSEKVDPSKILVLSMANRSVKSLRQRLLQKIGHLADLIQISTFHSLAATTLETYGSTFGTQYLNCILLDNSTWMAFLRFFSRLGVSINGVKLTSTIKPTALKDVIALVKSGKLLVKSAGRIYGVSPDYIDAVLQYLKENKLIHYSDLISSFRDVLKLSIQSNQMIEPLRKLDVVIVDEFQDMYPELISMIQKIIEYPSVEVKSEAAEKEKMKEKGKERGIERGIEEKEEIGETEVEEIEEMEMSNPLKSSHTSPPRSIPPLATSGATFKHLTIAGDPNQSIYEFLGLDPELMSNLGKIFPHHKVKEVILDTSFRLTPEILQFVEKATSFLVPALINETIQKPTIMEHHHHEDEAKSIVAEIIRLITLSGGLLKPRDFAVLTRSNYELTGILKCMLDCGLQATRIALTDPWLAHSTYHFVHFLMVLRSHGRSQFPLLCCLQIFDTNSARVLRLFNKGIDLEAFFFLNDADKEYSRSRSVLAQIRLFLGLIRLARESPPHDVLSTLEFLWDISNKTTFLKKVLSKEALLSEDIISFHRSLQYSYLNWTKLKMGEEVNGMFLDHFLFSYNEVVPNFETNKVNVSTVHSAKGLEFPIVFLAGTFALFGEPYWHSILSDAAIGKNASPREMMTSHEVEGKILNKQEAEKARLFYVASTRARNLLYVSKKTGKLNPELISVSASTKPEISRGIPEDSSPQDISNVIAKLAQEMDRPIPQGHRLIEGQRLYQQFKTSVRPATLKGVSRTLRAVFRR